MNRKSKTINLIQDRATPHNNVLISEFKKNTDVKLNVWYAEDQDIKLFANYPKLGDNLTNQYCLYMKILFIDKLDKTDLH